METWTQIPEMNVVAVPDRKLKDWLEEQCKEREQGKERTWRLYRSRRKGGTVVSSSMG
jgi:hypothetical protein